jgi:hypothetical protein
MSNLTEEEEFAFRARAERERKQSPAKSAEPTTEQRALAHPINRFFTGVIDPIQGGAQLMSRMPGAEYVNKATQFVNDLPVIGPATKAMGMTPATSGELDSRLKQQEQAYQEARKATGNTGIDWMRAGGNLATAMLPIGAGSTPATMLGRAGQSAAIAGGQSALNPVYENQGNFASEKAKQAGTGALVGALAAPVVEGAARVVSPKIDKYVQTLMDSGITLTPGQIMGGVAKRTEDKLTSVPFLGDAIISARKKGYQEFNRAAYARALEPAGLKAAKDTPVGPEGIAMVKGQLSDKYEQLLPKLGFKADEEFGLKMDNLQKMADQGLEPKEREAFNQILRDKVISKMTPDGLMNGRQFKDVESSLGQLIRDYSRDGRIEKQAVKDALKQVRQELRDGLIRSNPEYGPELSGINKAWANFKTVNKAGQRLGDKTEGFTPADYAAAVRGGDTSVDNGRYAAGQAFNQDLSNAAVHVLPNKYPDSGTPGRLLLMGAAGGGAHLLGAASHPFALGGAALSTLPYLPGGRQAMQALMTKGMGWREPAANALRAATPAFGLGGAQILMAPPVQVIGNK